MVWYLFKNQDIEGIVEDIKGANYWFILLSYVTGILSHLARAYRWNLLYQTLGYNPGVAKSFLAVMFGYFMNLVIPRAGEISRCGLLKRTDNIPMEESIGTVVAERAFDLLTIVVITGLAFLFNFDLFSSILNETGASLNIGASGANILIFGAVAGISILLLIYLFRKRLMKFAFIAKLAGFLQKVAVGVMSIKNVENKFMFILSTLIIWFLYFFTSYVVFFALPATSHLGLEVALALLIVSSMAMILPVQGGIGAYHLFVSTALVFYGLSQEDGLVYATIMHASTFLLLFIGGAISFFVAAWLANSSK